jgi:anaerobic selenocysteine-containing dehydrogenase/Fe-S-cluster-containing dehydrogenase component
VKFSLNRRSFLKLLGIGGASAALSGCSSDPVDKIIPYLIPPEESVPGIADWYATVCRECPAGCGLLVKLREGRPIKLEGNPLHPVNRGSLCMRGQTSIQGLYNPDRIREPLIRQENGEFKGAAFNEAEAILTELLKSNVQENKPGEIALITPLMTGSLEKLLNEWMDTFQITKRLFYEPVSYENITEANRIVFSRNEISLYSMEKAEMVLSFGADFLETWLSPVEYSKDFGAMKKAEGNGRFVAVGPRLSMTAANADEWIDLNPGTEKTLALGLVHFILKEELNAPLEPDELDGMKILTEDFTLERVASETGIAKEKIAKLGIAFAKAKPGLALGGGIAVQGDDATETSMAVNLLNTITGNIGKTVRFGHEIAQGKINPYRDMLGLIESMNDQKVKVLILYDVDPLFNLPASSGFKEALENVPMVVSFSSFMNDTAKQANLIIPVSSPLEEWGDTVPRKGVYGLSQPVIRPQYNTKSFGDILLSLKQDKTGPATFHDYLKDSWKGVHKDFDAGKDFGSFWEESLKRGGVWRIAKDRKVTLSTLIFQKPFQIDSKEKEEKPYSLFLYPSIKFFDGRGANKPVLHEVPDPITHITWDSWLEISPKTALALKVKEGDFVAAESKDGRLEAPVHIYEGIKDNAAAVPLGLGHKEYGRYARGRGVNPVHLLPKEPENMSGGLLWSSLPVKLEKVKGKKPLASTQGGRRQFGREIARTIFLGIGKSILHLKTDKEVKEEKRVDMYRPHPFKEHRWGMVIDLNACTGCNACVAACYMENNIPVVGEKEVARGREMAWIRIERYIETNKSGLDTRFIPMLCQQCDNAPCEPVCPVYATYHNPEGLNAQIYNRCVGTRYCSNNCPYKVRRFNWFNHSWPEPLNWHLNPDVTVREVGVMEKCTFCVQRIREKKEQAKYEGRKVRDGEIMPACAQTCPTGAITFGDLKDKESRVSRLSEDKRSYRVLEEVNTKPSVFYLKKIKREI